MNRDATVELISTGSELLDGRTANEHAQYLGGRLAHLGLRLLRETTVPDDRRIIAEAVQGALRRARIVFVTGGLGPTSDDVTREALSDLLKRRLTTDPVALEAMAKRYAEAGRSLTDMARRQAGIVESARALRNRVGAAPGQMLNVGRRLLFVLPGPPLEFRTVLEEEVFPILGSLLGPDFQTLEKTFAVCGRGESEVAALLERMGLPSGDIRVGYCASPGSVWVNLVAPRESARELERVAAALERELRASIFAHERSTMEEIVGRLLEARGLTLATAESCTGGRIGHRITAVAGSSAYYLGGVVAYADEAKRRLLGVRAQTLRRVGAVSGPIAREMAEGVRRRLKADVGLSITGIAGPSGGTAKKPVGTIWVAVADARGCVARRFQAYARERAAIREWAGQMALDLLRRRLSGSAFDGHVRRPPRDRK